MNAWRALTIVGVTIGGAVAFVAAAFGVAGGLKEFGVLCGQVSDLHFCADSDGKPEGAQTAEAEIPPQANESGWSQPNFGGVVGVPEPHAGEQPHPIFGGVGGTYVPVESYPAEWQLAPEPPLEFLMVPPELEEELRATALGEVDPIIVEGRAPSPFWRERPSRRAVRNAYPARALDRGIEGEARLRCVIDSDGWLSCEEISESRSGFGFGRAAQQLAGSYRHEPTLENGQSSAGAVVNLRVVFELEEGRRRHWDAR